MLDRQLDRATLDKVWDLMELPRVEYASEEDAWLAGWGGWAEEIKARVPEFLDLYESAKLSDDEKVYLMYLSFDMLHHARVKKDNPHWEQMARTLRRDINLHFPLIANWFHFTKSTLTDEGWLPPEELNPQLKQLIDEFAPRFRWTGQQYERASGIA